MCAYSEKEKRQLMPVKAKPREAQGRASRVYVVLACCCYPASSPICTLRIGLLLLGKERDVALYSPDGKSSDCKEDKDDDDDDRDGDVALNHLGW